MKKGDNLRILSGAQTKAVECYAVEQGMTFLGLMENAGTTCAEVIRDEVLHRLSGKKILVVSGTGKNGGDGFVVAGKLYEEGIEVSVLLCKGEPKDEESLEMLNRIKKIPIEIIGSAEVLNTEYYNNADIIVDAIFGTGFRGAMEFDILKVVELINKSKAIKVSIDIPSGLYCDSGEETQAFVKPDYTLALNNLNPVHVLVPASYYCGKVILCDIGITDDVYERLTGLKTFGLNDNGIKQLFKPISLTANKGDNGHVLSICGSKSMPGAAVLAAKGAVFSGAGLVTCAFPECAYPAISSKLTEPLLLPLEFNKSGTFSANSIHKLLPHIKKASSILVGCGLGLNKDTKALVNFILENAQSPVILDADALNAVAENTDFLKQIKVPLVLTPHPGEMSRLTGLSIPEIQGDRVSVAHNFAKEYEVTLVLKGANTVVADNNSVEVYVNITGNPGLAKGGSGDLLAGIIASFVAQGIGVGDACIAGVYLHGLAGDRAAARLSVRGVTPTECAEELQSALNDFEILI